MRKLKAIEMQRISIDEFKASDKLPLTIVLDDVRSMHNVGSVFRTCDAFRCEHICLCGITATPPQNEIHKTALGAEDSVSWTHHPTALNAVRDLHQRGYIVYAIEQCEGSTMLNQFSPTDTEGSDPLIRNRETKVAVVLGNEVHGVHQEVIDQCDGCIEIPQYGTKHSLNVSVTAGIVIWHMFLMRNSL